MSQSHALVVGGTRGLGLAAAKSLLRDGHIVTTIARRPPDDSVPGLRFVAADLLDASGVDEALDRVITESGPVRYLVFAQRFRGVGDPWAGEIAITLTASRHVLERLADRFEPEGDRGIVAVGSVYGSFVGDGQPAGYHVAKAGLEQLMRYYAFIWGRRGIRANVVAPCTFLKQESREVFERNKPLMAMYEEFVPLGRLGTADEAADVIAFLCTQRAAFLTGQTIMIDGGASLVWPETAARRAAHL
jgi:NAD(P)-dependent dehydrogenase (short-subunit alcohol dehydrogenase family)